MKTRCIPTNYKLYKKTNFVEVYKSELYASNKDSLHQVIGMLFSGKKSNPDWHYKFKSIEMFDKKIEVTNNNYERWENTKLERKEARKQEVLDVTIGDIFVYSWVMNKLMLNFFK